MHQVDFTPFEIRQFDKNLKYHFVYAELGLVLCIKIVFMTNLLKKNNILISFKTWLVSSVYKAIVKRDAKDT